MVVEKIRNALQVQKQSGLYRNPPCIQERDGHYLLMGDKRVLNFASNDYLGLATYEPFRRQVANNFLRYGTSSSSSRLVAGNYSVINDAESAFAHYFGYEDALFFPSGYQANLAVFSTLFGPNDILLFDKHVHASCVKGMALSRALLKGYNHASIAHLTKRLEQVKAERPVLVTESLFSMDGDLIDPDPIVDLKRSCNIFCVVDEAHAFGTIGLQGRGVARMIADLAVGTLGKAFGLFGAFVLMSSEMKDYFFNFASPLIYTTTLPEAHAASAVDALEHVSRFDDRRERLRETSSAMRALLEEAGFRVSGDAHIISVSIGDETLCAALSEGLLKERDIFVLPARYPTVPLHRAILRISMTALHTERDVEYFVESLNYVLKRIR